MYSVVYYHTDVLLFFSTETEKMIVREMSGGKKSVGHPAYPVDQRGPVQ